MLGMTSLQTSEVCLSMQKQARKEVFDAKAEQDKFELEKA